MKSYNKLPIKTEWYCRNEKRDHRQTRIWIPNLSKLNIAIIILITSSVIQGCTTYFGVMPFDYIPSLPSSEPINIRVGIEKLLDKRPETDRSTIKDTVDLDERVTHKLFEDFQSSKIFSEVDYPVKKERDMLIIKGDIKRFYYKSTLYYAGITSFIAEVNLHVQLVDSGTGKLVAEYDKSSVRKDSLSEAFRDVVKQIKENIVSDFKEGRLKVSK